MTDVVILVPYRPDGGRRGELWEFTFSWLMRHHDSWAVLIGDSPEGAFNRGTAINDAARKAGDWDVAIVSDADNICDPVTLSRAVSRAEYTKGCVFPFDTYFYLDEHSTNRLIAHDSWFVSPLKRSWGVIPQHNSGIQVLSRVAYDQVGGFPELPDWGYEDCIMTCMLKALTSGIDHLQGGAYHLYHGDDIDLEKRHPSDINRRILADVMALSVVPDQLRKYLRAGGHPIV